MSITLPLSSEAAKTSVPPTRERTTSPALSSEAREILGDFEDKFIEVGTCASTGKRVTICYNTFGDPSNPCLLLVQGLGSSLLVYLPRFVQLFVDQGYYVIRYDNRDTGLSTQFNDFAPPALIRLSLPQWMSIGERLPYVLNDIMEDGIGLLTALNIRQAHVFGMSMGGMIVQLMAIHHPERVLSLNILFSHVGGADVVNPSLLHYARFLAKPRSNSADDRAAHMAWFIDYLSQGAYKGNLEKVKKFILSTYERNGVGDDRGMQRQAAAVMRAPSRAKGLRKVTCPTLILHGAKDPLIPVANGYRLADLVPNAKLVIFPRLAHYLPLELMKPIADEVVLNMSLAKPS
ncbi:putative hydrolase, alpha/beta fold family [Leishmania mexicana MHOM/GT/2001/U1103]|uniref:Hydrolase, alpha/beta fold family n=1 Tax=Leishmania mexicana (strain MHOM/GT/2001/U1103) TaxID=929439 RepID=E9AZX7_LEIMU|nr:putative hydrolase, alpha/beta fold family [Leishmania mexicana MHOM/GT/2001/U1103]CBZ28528.1 putative hydrolase, alpha/beta fold family [Leishmania mexicana MHOM/GT/2001/U1103]